MEREWVQKSEKVGNLQPQTLERNTSKKKGRVANKDSKSTGAGSSYCLIVEHGLFETEIFDDRKKSLIQKRLIKM